MIFKVVPKSISYRHEICSIKVKQKHKTFHPSSKTEIEKIIENTELKLGGFTPSQYLSCKEKNKSQHFLLKENKIMVNNNKSSILKSYA